METVNGYIGTKRSSENTCGTKMETKPEDGAVLKGEDGSNMDTETVERSGNQAGNGTGEAMSGRNGRQDAKPAEGRSEKGLSAEENLAEDKPTEKSPSRNVSGQEENPGDCKNADSPVEAGKEKESRVLGDAEKERNEVPATELAKDWSSGSTGLRRTARLCNLALFDRSRSAGPLDIPALAPTDFVPESLVNFGKMSKGARTGQTVHFFEHDSVFEMFWRSPETCAERIRKFGSMIAPDFSMYIQMPRVMQQWNCYRSQILAQYCQRLGIVVIPRIRFCGPDTYGFCFDGIPENSVLAVSTVGFIQMPVFREMFREGMREAIRRLKPMRLVVYGTMIPDAFGEVPVTRFETTNQARLRVQGCRKNSQGEEGAARES